MTAEIGFEVRLELPYGEALTQTKEALQGEGFGVLTAIDVKATMKEKLNIEFRPYTILGACNPPLAHRALSEDAAVGLLLPCNVTVEAGDEQTSIIRIVNPQILLGVGSLEENSEIAEVAREARTRLERVAEALLAG